LKKNGIKNSEKREPIKSKLLNSSGPEDLFKKSIEKYFKNVSINTASYLQSVSDLQQEIIESRKKNAESIILLQKFLIEQINSHSKIPVKSLELITDFAEQGNKAWNFQNQLMQKSIDVLSNNIKAFNNNAHELTEMNKKLIESWAEVIKKSKKEN
jgi:hypothetical protein